MNRKSSRQNGMVKLSVWKLLIADLFLAVFFVSVWNWKKVLRRGTGMW